MPKRIRKRYVFLNLFIVFSVLLSLVITVCSAREYTATLTMGMDEYYITDFSYEVVGDHIEVTDIHTEGADLILTVKPLSMGEDGIEINYTMNDRPDQNFEYIRFYSGPFGTIFSLITFIDFNGSIYVVLLILLDLLVITTVMILSFINYLKRSDFGYPMVACGGIGLFCLFYLLLNLYTLLEFGADSSVFFFMETFGGYLYELSNLSGQFTFFTAPFMVIFSIALMVSNLYLIRREGFRFVNLLGIIFGVLWLTGFALDMFIDDNLYGSLEYVAILSSLSNALATLISYFECMLFFTILCAYFASRHRPPFDRDYIVILGCSIQKDGTLTPLLRGRVDAALDFAREQKEKTGKSVKFVPSGGQGSDERISEGEAMRRYLIEQGVADENILPEIKSTNTYENFKFSKEVIEADTNEAYNPAFATTNYHIFRGYILSKKNNFKNAQGISAKTKWYFFPNAFLRELVGLIVDEKRIHLVVIAILVVFFVLLTISSFV